MLADDAARVADDDLGDARELEQLGHGDAGRTGASGQGPRSFAAFHEDLVPGTALPKPEGVFPRHEEPAED